VNTPNIQVNHIIHLRKKVVNGPNVFENSAHSLSTFLFFDKDILGNEAATELRIKAKLSNLRQKPESEHGVVLHLTIRPYYTTMEFPWLLLHFHEKQQRCPRSFHSIHIWNRKLLVWVGDFSQHFCVFFNTRTPAMSISTFFLINALFFAATAFYRFSNFNLSNRFLCSLFFGQ